MTEELTVKWMREFWDRSAATVACLEKTLTSGLTTVPSDYLPVTGS
jgi:hypothetical protein